MSQWSISIGEREVTQSGFRSGFNHTTVQVVGPGGEIEFTTELLFGAKVHFSGEPANIENSYTFVDGLTYEEAIQVFNEAASAAPDIWGIGGGYELPQSLNPAAWMSAFSGHISPDVLEAVTGRADPYIHNSNAYARIVHDLIVALAEQYDYGTVAPIIDDIFSRPAPGWEYTEQFGSECFLAGTQVDMWPLDPDLKPDANGAYDLDEVMAKIWQKPIEDVSVGDVVVASDRNGILVPGHVPRTFKNHVKRILDFWGTGVTPGHVYLCGDGKFKGQDVSLLDILRSDGAIINRDGTLIRAATSAPVGSKYDQFVSVVTGDLRPDGTVDVKESGRIRAGTHYIDSEGQTRILMSALLSNNGVLLEDGMVSKDIFNASGQPFHWTFTDSIPKPEDYILQRSKLTLAEIYAVGEWERVKPQMPAPVTDTAIGHPTVAADGGTLQSFEPHANIPPAFPNRPDAPTTKPTRPSMNRKQRKAMEAKARTRPKARIHS